MINWKDIDISVTPDNALVEEYVATLEDRAELVEALTLPEVCDRPLYAEVIRASINALDALLALIRSETEGREISLSGVVGNTLGT